MISEQDSVDKFKIKIEQDEDKAERIRKIRKAATDYQERINHFLKKGAYQELLEYFYTEKIKQIARIENEVAIMGIMLGIYQMETEEGIEPGIFAGISTLKSAIERYLKIKFLMWRLEFLNEKEQLSELIEKDSVSVPFFKYLIHTSSFEKANTSFKIAMLMKEKRKWGQSFAMLNYVNELSPGEEIVFCEMADICISMGQIKSAVDCLGRIENPSQLLVKYQERWGI